MIELIPMEFNWERSSVLVCRTLLFLESWRLAVVGLSMVIGLDRVVLVLMLYLAQITSPTRNIRLDGVDADAKQNHNSWKATLHLRHPEVRGLEELLAKLFRYNLCVTWHRYLWLETDQRLFGQIDDDRKISEPGCNNQ